MDGLTPRSILIVYTSEDKLKINQNNTQHEIKERRKQVRKTEEQRKKKKAGSMTMSELLPLGRGQVLGLNMNRILCKFEKINKNDLKKK